MSKWVQYQAGLCDSHGHAGVERDMQSCLNVFPSSSAVDSFMRLHV